MNNFACAGDRAHLKFVHLVPALEVGGIFRPYDLTVTSKSKAVSTLHMLYFFFGVVCLCVYTLGKLEQVQD